MATDTVYSDYKYFKGESRCPFEDFSEQAKWWAFEKRFHDSGGKSTDFLDYLYEWIREKAAPNQGWNLEKQGNPWLIDYYKNAPGS